MKIGREGDRKRGREERRKRGRKEREREEEKQRGRENTSPVVRMQAMWKPQAISCFRLVLALQWNGFKS